MTQKLRDSSQPLTEPCESINGNQTRRITYRGTVYAVGEEVEDRNTGDCLTITGFNGNTLVWVRQGEGSPYCVGMASIRKLESPAGGEVVTNRDPISELAADLTAEIAPEIAQFTAEITPSPIPPSPHPPTSPISPIDGELLPPPAEHLTQLENEIETGTQLRAEGERRIWMAAAAIRQHDLWQLHTHQDKPIYKSFPDYCKQKWGWERSYSHAIAQTGQVVLQLKQSGIADTLLPDSVSQGTELAKLEPEQRLEVIDRVLEERGRLSAKAIREAREQYLEEDHQSIVGDGVQGTGYGNQESGVQHSSPTPSSRPWHLGDFVEGLNAAGEWVKGSVHAVGDGFLLLDGERQVEQARLLHPCPISAPAPGVGGRDKGAGRQGDGEVPCPKVRLKVTRRLRRYIERHGGLLSVIAQLEGQTCYLQVHEISLEDF